MSLICELGAAKKFESNKNLVERSLNPPAKSTRQKNLNRDSVRDILGVRPPGDLPERHMTCLCTSQGLVLNIN